MLPTKVESMAAGSLPSKEVELGPSMLAGRDKREGEPLSASSTLVLLGGFSVVALGGIKRGGELALLSGSYRPGEVMSGAG